MRGATMQCRRVIDAIDMIYRATRIERGSFAGEEAAPTKRVAAATLVVLPESLFSAPRHYEDTNGHERAATARGVARSRALYPAIYMPSSHCESPLNIYWEPFGRPLLSSSCLPPRSFTYTRDREEGECLVVSLASRSLGYIGAIDRSIEFEGEKKKSQMRSHV